MKNCLLKKNFSYPPPEFTDKKSVPPQLLYVCPLEVMKTDNDIPIAKVTGFHHLSFQRPCKVAFNLRKSFLWLLSHNTLCFGETWGRLVLLCSNRSAESPELRSP